MVVYLVGQLDSHIVYCQCIYNMQTFGSCNWGLIKETQCTTTWNYQGWKSTLVSINNISCILYLNKRWLNGNSLVQLRWNICWHSLKLHNQRDEQKYNHYHVVVECSCYSCHWSTVKMGTHTGYIYRGMESSLLSTRSVIFTSVPNLLDGCLQPPHVDNTEQWQSLPDTPNYFSGAASLGGSLLAVGGQSQPSAGSVYLFLPLCATPSYVYAGPSCLHAHLCG